MIKSNLTPSIVKAFTYEKYLKDEEIKINLPQDFEYKQYHVLNFQRMNRIGKQAGKQSFWSAEELEHLKGKSIRLIAITEGWCGDAAQIIPWINQLTVEAKIPFHLLYRDENTKLMNEYLTNDGMAIPIIILADENGNYLNHWGPRPKEAQDLMISARAKDNDKDDISLALQNWYNKDKGNTIIAEIKAMVKSAFG